MFDGMDFSKLNLNDMMNQVQDIANKAKEENASKVFTAKLVEVW